ncbi:unnamed protein product [Eruca vesicaria subsp. sativa]|uniref:Uncharacterized protein n=1 Tax=Eruca vesicaria subsp. sativa TaxID=29727 RepID=A0ABC8LEZ1_ERUVS|nr:unnamed protein product [Eruca vesicaria subsp. sativa]
MATSSFLMNTISFYQVPIDVLSNGFVNTQEFDFSCRARIVGVLQQNGWSYVSHGCSRKLDKSGTSLRCNRFLSPNVTWIFRSCVEVSCLTMAKIVLCLSCFTQR